MSLTAGVQAGEVIALATPEGRLYRAVLQKGVWDLVADASPIDLQRDPLPPSALLLVLKTSDGFIGFRSAVAEGRILQVTKDKALRLSNYNFADWEMFSMKGSSLHQLTLTNRKFIDKVLSVCLHRPTLAVTAPAPAINAPPGDATVPAVTLPPEGNRHALDANSHKGSEANGLAIPAGIDCTSKAFKGDAEAPVEASAAKPEGPSYEADLKEELRKVQAVADTAKSAEGRVRALEAELQGLKEAAEETARHLREQVKEGEKREAGLLKESDAKRGLEFRLKAVEGEAAKARGEMERSRMQVVELEGKLKHMGEIEGKLEEAERRVEEREKLLVSLRESEKALVALKKSEGKEKESLAAEKKKEKVVLEGKVAAAEATLATMARRVTGLEKQVVTDEGEKKRLGEEMKRVGEENKRLAVEKGRLGEEMKRVGEENKRLAEEKGRLGEEKKQWEEVKEQLGMAVRAAEEREKKGLDKSREAEEGLKRWKGQARVAEVRVMEANEKVRQLEAEMAETLEEEMKKLREVKQQLNVKEEKLKVVEGQVEEMKKQVKKLDGEVQSARKAAEHAAGKAEAGLIAQVAALRKELTDALQAAATAEERANVEEEKFKDAEERVAEADKRVEGAKARAGEAEKSAREAEEEVKGVKEESSRLQKRVEEAEERGRVLEGKVGVAEAALAAALGNVVGEEQLKEFEERVEKADVARRKAEYAAEAEANKASDLQDQLAAAEAQLAELEDRRQMELEEVKHEAGEAQQRLSALQAESEGREEAFQGLRKYCEEVEGRAQAAEQHRGQEQDLLVHQIQSLQGQVGSLQLQLQHAEEVKNQALADTVAAVSGSKEREQQLMRQVEELRANLLAAQQQREEKKSFREVTLEGEIVQLKVAVQDVAIWRLRVHELEGKLREAETVQHRQVALLTAEEEKVQAAHETIARLQEQVSSHDEGELEATILDATERVQAAESKAEAAQQVASDAERHAAGLSEKLTAAEDLAAALKKENRNLRRSEGDKAREVLAQAARIAELQAAPSPSDMASNDPGDESSAAELDRARGAGPNTGTSPEKKPHGRLSAGAAAVPERKSGGRLSAGGAGSSKMRKRSLRGQKSAEVLKAEEEAAAIEAASRAPKPASPGFAYLLTHAAVCVAAFGVGVASSCHLC